MRSMPAGLRQQARDGQGRSSAKWLRVGIRANRVYRLEPEIDSQGLSKYSTIDFSLSIDNAGFDRLPSVRPPPTHEGFEMSPDHHPGPAFKANAYKDGKFIEVTDKDLKGKWSVLIFMPAAFTFNCPTEIEDAADHYAEFQKGRRGLHRHHRHPFLAQGLARDLAGGRQGQVPLVGDPTHALTKAFGVHIPDEAWPCAAPSSSTGRHDQDAGSPRQRYRPRRPGAETVRKLKAAQFVASHPGNAGLPGEVEGSAEKTIKPSLDLVGKNLTLPCARGVPGPCPLRFPWLDGFVNPIAATGTPPAAIPGEGPFLPALTPAPSIARAARPCRRQSYPMETDTELQVPTRRHLEKLQQPIEPGRLLDDS